VAIEIFEISMVMAIVVMAIDEDEEDSRIPGFQGSNSRAPQVTRMYEVCKGVRV
jgi:hypothetical protein